MPTEVYKTKKIYTIDGLEIEVMPLKIKFLKEFMITFKLTAESKDQETTINILSECARIAMNQYVPGTFTTIDDIQDRFDMATIYQILRYSAGININKEADIENVVAAQNNDNPSTWEDLDLAKLETEVFLLGIWKNFDELETSLSIEELMQILSITRELDYEEKKFLAALQGVDLGGGSEPERGQKEWEDLKARVASGGQATDSKDILALQGTSARQAGFGIGLGLGYEDLRDPSVIKKT
jgi:translation initiation factor 1 (eIF-1/SUI1)